MNDYAGLVFWQGLLGNIGGQPAYGDGNFWIAKTCTRCDEEFFVWAAANDTTPWDRRCDFCKGKISAAQQSFHTEAISKEFHAVNGLRKF